jgi:hypothetical protein
VLGKKRSEPPVAGATVGSYAASSEDSKESEDDDKKEKDRKRINKKRSFAGKLYLLIHIIYSTYQVICIEHIYVHSSAVRTIYYCLLYYYTMYIHLRRYRERWTTCG